MSPTAIHPTRTPLAEAYAEQKKQVSEQKKPVSPRTSAKQLLIPEDRVTLSSDPTEEHDSPAKLKPSQPVTFEEMQALRAMFSVRV